MKRWARNLLVLAALSVGVPGVAAQTPGDPLADEEHSSPSLEAIARFASVYHLIKAAYVEPVSDETLIEAAIQGMLSSLDPYSGYLDADDLDVLTDDTLGAYDGLGVEVLSGEGLLQVMAAMPDSPAARADLKPGDLITHIDGVAVERANMDESVRKLRGRPGTRIRLTVQRVNDETAHEVELVRARIRLSSVHAQALASGYGYAHVRQCRQDTPAELARHLRRLERRGTPLRGLVLDLRENPGGTLDCAIALSDLFLAQGRIVSIEGRGLAQAQRYDARTGDAWEALPLAVLIDEGTASAAEIVASALKTHERAVVLGRRSFGKASVQNLFSLDGDHAVRLTTARYHTADGHSIHGQGVHPNVELTAEQVQFGASPDQDDAVLRALSVLKERTAGDRIHQAPFDG